MAVVEAVRLAPSRVLAVPQIWLTYEELAEHFGGYSEEARTRVGAEGWSRRRSRDGLTRVKLPPATAVEYMRAAVRGLDDPAATDQQVAALRRMLGLMQPHGDDSSSRSVA